MKKLIPVLMFLSVLLPAWSKQNIFEGRLQTDLDANGFSVTNARTLRATNFIDAATGLPYSTGGGSGAVTNAVTGIKTNGGVVLSTGATNLNFAAGSNSTVRATVSGGTVTLMVDTTGGTGSATNSLTDLQVNSNGWYVISTADKSLAFTNANFPSLVFRLETNGPTGRLIARTAYVTNAGVGNLFQAETGYPWGRYDINGYVGSGGLDLVNNRLYDRLNGGDTKALDWTFRTLNNTNGDSVASWWDVFTVPALSLGGETRTNWPSGTTTTNSALLATTNQTFTGTNTFSNAANSFTGSFTGDASGVSNAPVLTGNTLWVDPVNGVDNMAVAGDEGKPWLTLGLAVSNSVPGDLVRVRAGTNWCYGTNVIHAHGITIEGDGADTTWIMATNGVALQGPIALFNSTLRKVTIHNKSDPYIAGPLNCGIAMRAVYPTSTNVLVEDCNIHGQSDGIILSSTNLMGWTIRRCYVSGGDAVASGGTFNTNSAVTIEDCTLSHLSSDEPADKTNVITRAAGLAVGGGTWTVARTRFQTHTELDDENNQGSWGIGTIGENVTVHAYDCVFDCTAVGAGPVGELNTGFASDQIFLSNCRRVVGGPLRNMGASPNAGIHFVDAYSGTNIISGTTPLTALTTNLPGTLVAPGYQVTVKADGTLTFSNAPAGYTDAQAQAAVGFTNGAGNGAGLTNIPETGISSGSAEAGAVLLSDGGGGAAFGTGGSALTGLNASALASGTVPVARLATTNSSNLNGFLKLYAGAIGLTTNFLWDGADFWITNSADMYLRHNMASNITSWVSNGVTKAFVNGKTGGFTNVSISASGDSRIGGISIVAGVSALNDNSCGITGNGLRARNSAGTGLFDFGSSTHALVHGGTGIIIVRSNLVAQGSLLGTNGISSLATDAAVNIAATGWTNTFGKLAWVDFDGTAMTFTVYNNAGTALYTNTVAHTGYAGRVIQNNGKIIITGTGVVGTASPL